MWSESAEQDRAIDGGAEHGPDGEGAGVDALDEAGAVYGVLVTADVDAALSPTR